MKNAREDFDLMVKNSLNGMEIPPPAGLKKGVFGMLGRYALMQKIKRNSLYLLLLLLLSTLGIFAYITIHQPIAKTTANQIHNSPGLNSTAPSSMDKNQKTSNKINPDPKANEPEIKNTNFIHGNNPSTLRKTEKISKNTNVQAPVLTGVPQKQKSENMNQIVAVTKEKAFAAVFDKTSILANGQTFVETKAQTAYLAGSSNSNFSLTPEKKPSIFTTPKIRTSDVFPASADLLPLNSVTQAKKFHNPLLWSIGISAGHTLYQNQMISLPSSFDDNNYSFNTSMEFPSFSIGLDARAEKKHIFFDFGVQYAHFTEIISSGDVMLNPHEEQFVNWTGQTLQIDTAGGYYHYYYLCDSIVRVLDSVWTWNIDSSLVNNYDTINEKVYDTLKNPEWKNSYTFIEIPFFFGWQHNFGKVNIGLKTGPLLSMLIGTKGYIPSNISENATLNETGSEFKKFRLGLSWQVSAVASYFISERVLIECQPYYRFAIIGIKSPTGYTLKNNSLGLTVGIRYYF